ncbi:hypothetical protein CANARDRAFT_7722 [[Candida] arabinofermentans NRRL YB-2248]|uniref:Uncharacterized protein n=1 Tax=[Candida] arabinofermentans NRRL YB-2248 TaxID=983967 RepID=A0A1E4T1J4_9ASCO|nr:hypothetical protein CANARDRAFT_7722 [[Candida] arabinofermentans NRRL YB-2248]
MPDTAADRSETGEASDVALFAEIPLTKQDILNCSYSNWYNKFNKHTLSRVEILKPIPKEFVDYLASDEFTLPKEAPHESSLFTKPRCNSDNEYSDWEDDELVETSNNSKRPDPTLKFNDFHNDVKRVFTEFKSVAPKLNWSAPQDSTWIMVNKTMQCHSPSDVYLLLKSSDYINHDLYHAFDGLDDQTPVEPSTFDYELVLREWVDVNPSMEFRCFVRDRQLIAISQRDLNYYDFLEEIQDQVLEKIAMFFDDVLLPKFDSNSFVFDVYIPKTIAKVFLIDINPFARKTDSLLFSWHELATLKVDDDDVKFRLVTKYNTGQFASKAHGQNHVPKDVLDASLDTAGMIELAQRWAKLLSSDGTTNLQDDDDDDDEDDTDEL